MSALGLIVLYFLINAPDLFGAADASTFQLRSLARNINYGVCLGLVVAAILNVINVVRELYGSSVGGWAARIRRR